jgi:hypothetical protein
MLTIVNTFAGGSRGGFLCTTAITLAAAAPSTSTSQVALTDTGSIPDLGAPSAGSILLPKRKVTPQQGCARLLDLHLHQLSAAPPLRKELGGRI